MIWVWFLACVLIWYAPKSTKRSFGIGLVVSFILGVSSIWNYGWYTEVPFFETDLSEYCVAIEIMSDDWLNGDMPPKRSRLAALLPWWLSKYWSMLDALALSSIVCTVGTFLCIYIWSWALFGVGPALMSTLALSMMAPMVLMSRFLTFYPPIVLATVFAGMVLSLWWKFRNGVTALICGVGIGLCLCIDVRGVVWAVPFWTGAMALLILGEGYLKRMGHFVALNLPVWGSWFLGWWAYTANSASLEKQMDVRPLYVGFDEDNPLFQPPWHIDSHFVWGWFEVQEIPDTINFIVSQRSYDIPADFLAWQQTGSSDNIYVAFWNSILLFSIVVSSIAIWRNVREESRWKAFESVLLLVCTVSPFILLFDSLTEMVEQHIRFYLHGLPGIAILMGGATGLVVARNEFKLKNKSWYAILWCVCVAGLGSLLHFSSWSPLYAQAEWRNKWSITSHEYTQMRRHLSGATSNLKDYGKECVEVLRDEGINPTVYP